MVGAGLATSLAACAGARPSCAPPSVSYSRLVAMPIAPPRDSLRLRVRRLDIDVPLAAEVRLDDGRWVPTEADGTLSLPLPRSRSFQVQVRAISFGLAQLRMRPAPDSGLQMLAAMAPMTLHIDEYCR